MTQWPARLVLVGAGKMGGAMAQGWLDAGLPPSSLTIVEPNPSPRLLPCGAAGALRSTTRYALARPRCWSWRSSRRASSRRLLRSPRSLGERTLLLSIIAGKTIANLLARFPQARAVVRAMPNTPAAIGRGVTAAFANADVTCGAAPLVRAPARRGRGVLLA